MTHRKKLIEVALPLDAINKESAREKSIRHGHPSTLHLWWARRPLAACRAVLFASLVDDPSNDLPAEEAKKERDRLFGILEELVKWDNSNDENVLGRARAEILRSTGGDPPPVLDPFCGGGSIPLEAQRLGLEAYGSDLNPVAVLITKALIEIPPKFAGKPPINPESRQGIGHAEGWNGARGLAADVRYYAAWMRDEAEKRIGYLYPKGPNEETVIAWLWSRTVRCPNPACHARMPLVRSFWLSKKQEKMAWIEPIVNREAKEVRFKIRTGGGKPQVGTVNRQGAACIVCDTPVPFNHIRAEGKAGNMRQQLMAVVTERQRVRQYLAPSLDQVAVAEEAQPTWRPETELPYNPRNFNTPIYGLDTFDKLFTQRQLVALTTFSDLVDEARTRVLQDAAEAPLPEDGTAISEDNSGFEPYANAVATYLALAVDKMTLTNSTACTWQTEPTRLTQAYSRQAIPMNWDYAEANPFGNAAGDYNLSVRSLTEVLDRLVPALQGEATQHDAREGNTPLPGPLVSTDPPYYDNILYADLSDYFYIWLRRSLAKVYPNLFSTMLAPKAQELVATPYRFDGDKRKAQLFFEEGLGRAFKHARTGASGDYPLTIFYAFKQTESAVTGGHGTSTGWETMLEGLLQANFSIVGTWPMRTELIGSLKRNVSALASSIVLVCRPRSDEAPLATRQEFVRALRRELPDALSVMMAENVAPVDLAQATIGPGMAIYSRYSRIVEADGSPMRVRTALQIINQFLDEHLSEAEGDVDPHTRFALTWFEQHGTEVGPYPDAEGIAKARNVSVRGMQDAGILEARVGKARLVRREELPQRWDPATDGNLTDWEIVQHLIRALEMEGETGAARLLARTGEQSERARDLAYRLYGVSERKGWAGEALAYNGLVTSWPEISRLAAENPSGEESQTSMDFS